jgi:hypothetical protein
MKRFSKKFYNGMNPSDTVKEKRKEGEINVEYTPEKNKSTHTDAVAGEYVDYEEIK